MILLVAGHPGQPRRQRIGGCRGIQPVSTTETSTPLPSRVCALTGGTGSSTGGTSGSVAGQSVTFGVT